MLSLNPSHSHSHIIPLVAQMVLGAVYTTLDDYLTHDYLTHDFPLDTTPDDNLTD